MAESITIRPYSAFRNALAGSGRLLVRTLRPVGGLNAGETAGLPEARALELIRSGAVESVPQTPRMVDRPSVLSGFASDATALAFAGLKRVGFMKEDLGFALSGSTSRLQAQVGVRTLGPRFAALAAKGASITLGTSRTPAWISTSVDASTDPVSGWKVLETYPPVDLGIYRQLFYDLALMLKREFGLAGLYWEGWNEPAVIANSTSGFWRGTQQQLFLAWAAMALGVKEADPSARIGSISVSPWLVPSDEGYTKVLLQAFFEFVAQPPKDLNGGARLPLDFVSWHNFFDRPESNWIAANQIRGFLTSSGLNPAPPQIVNEWNLVTALSSSDVTTDGEKGAASIASALFEADRLGVEGHCFASLSDFTDVASPNLFVGGQGLYTKNPDVKKAGAHVMEMLGRLAGQRIAVEFSPNADANGIGALASMDGRTVYLLAFRFLPDATGLAELQTVLYQSGILTYPEYLTTAEVSTYLAGGALPAWIPADKVAAFAAAKAAALTANASPSTIDVQFVTSEMGTPKAYRIYRINSGATNNPRAAYEGAGGSASYAAALAAAQARATLTISSSGSGAIPQLTLGQYEVVFIEADF